MTADNKVLDFIVDESANGERLDKYLAGLLPDFSRSRLQVLAEDNQITVNERKARSSLRLCINDHIRVIVPLPREYVVEPQDIDLPIIFEDNDIVVVNKPRGMVVHPAAGNWQGTVVNALLHHCKDLSGIGGVLRPGIVHRLDKDTSGLLVVAKNDDAHNALSQQLKNRTMSREYLAIVRGRSENIKFIVDAPIGRDSNNRLRMAVREQGKAAHSSFSVVENFTKHMLVKCKLQTGRTHQIRVHLAYVGLPIYGDPVYGGTNYDRAFGGQALHAACLKLSHPRNGEEMTFTAVLPMYFQDLLKKLRRG